MSVLQTNNVLIFMHIFVIKIELEYVAYEKFFFFNCLEFDLTGKFLSFSNYFKFRYNFLLGSLFSFYKRIGDGFLSYLFFKLSAYLK